VSPGVVCGADLGSGLKVVKVKDVSRGKSLIDSHRVNVKYKTGILERYCACIVVKGYLRKDVFRVFKSNLCSKKFEQNPRSKCVHVFKNLF